ncbi:radical SAM family heme chaperone HemW [Sulfuriroseicoccus oceanibius]|uniref:Heme chaperone HemW n=1 Tax=Sulfuriroseicoccus oceanibius TaxID=2707525 RepID=A0A6B3L4Q2_9BACT|nr:radical SAM family heme chaperone HemW [Sulfuriroseicoccus oceanibius]QQL43787.1 radical SAM family heme chaperone HemW [Sulfuriroseicoccus oceanibius]
MPDIPHINPAPTAPVTTDASLQHLYVHIPFCHKICPYCSFYKHTPGNTDMAAFVEALATELETRASQFTLAPKTIYFGGGTPSLLSRTHLSRLFERMHDILDLSALQEWTFEANPRTFTPEKLQLMRDAGVSRVSLGVQSWRPEQLKVLGRDHSPDEARTAYEQLRAADFPTVNVDLMFAHPGQALEHWRDDLEQTIALAPDHISTYNLTYEEDTEFFDKFSKGEFHQDADDDAPFFELMVERLGAAGFDNYEISNHARPGHRSQHNAAYWAGADFLGIGPGAVSTIGRTRWTNLPDTAKFIESMQFRRAAETDIEPLSESAWIMERVALELRTDTGLALTRLSNLEGADQRVDAMLEAGHVTQKGQSLVLTRSGKLLADEVAAYLLG